MYRVIYEGNNFQFYVAKLCQGKSFILPITIQDYAQVALQTKQLVTSFVEHHIEMPWKHYSHHILVSYFLSKTILDFVFL